MSKDLTVFVTGASVGFGAATARRFAADGAGDRRGPHVNVNVIELMPVVQSFSALQVHRG